MKKGRRKGSISFEKQREFKEVCRKFVDDEMTPDAVLHWIRMQKWR